MEIYFHYIRNNEIGKKKFPPPDLYVGAGISTAINIDMKQDPDCDPDFFDSEGIWEFSSICLASPHDARRSFRFRSEV